MAAAIQPGMNLDNIDQDLLLEDRDYTIAAFVERDRQHHGNDIQAVYEHQIQKLRIYYTPARVNNVRNLTFGAVQNEGIRAFYEVLTLDELGTLGW